MDWKQQAKQDYMAGGVTYRELAEKYGVSAETMRRAGGRGRWGALRRELEQRATEQAMDSAVAHQARRMERMQAVADQLMDKLEQAVGELNTQLVRRTQRVREIEYSNPEAPGKPTKELVTEQEQLLETAVTVDRRGLRELTTVMKNLRDIQHLQSELDEREQRARIAALERRGAEPEEQWVQLRMEDALEEFCQ